MSTDSARQIEHRAAAWLTKRDSGDWTQTDETSLKAWMEEATAHRVAFIRLEMVWDESQRLKALAAGLPPKFGEQSNWTLPLFDARQLSPGGDGSVSLADALDDSPELPDNLRDASPPPASLGTARAARTGARFLAAAAAIVLAVGATYFARDWFTGERYSTKVGVVSSVPLEDGSSVMLNTASDIRVDLNEQERRVDLKQGEAFFNVAKDSKRPFVVTAGSKRITAIGTQFSVRREHDELRVVVTEGKVRIDDAAHGRGRATPADSASSSNPAPAGDEPVLLAAGTIARTQKDAVLVQKTSVPQTEEVLSWRSGYLSFRDTPLSEAIEQFNQYNVQQLSASDPQVAQIPLTGKFKATNYEAFVNLLQEGYGIKVTREGERIALSH